jgi:DNA-binding CsgD family transcriptional regulator
MALRAHPVDDGGPAPDDRPGGAPGAAAGPRRPRVLTPRERDVTRLVAAGLDNRRVAQQLALSQGTIKIHLHHIYGKLRVTGRLALAAWAREQGLA